MAGGGNFFQLILEICEYISIAGPLYLLRIIKRLHLLQYHNMISKPVGTKKIFDEDMLF